MDHLNDNYEETDMIAVPLDPTKWTASVYVLARGEREDMTPVVLVLNDNGGPSHVIMDDMETVDAERVMLDLRRVMT